MHFVNIDPRFRTLTFKWCIFFNLLIANWEIPLMFNSLFIYQPTNTKKQRNIRLSMIDVYLQICIQKYISISRIFFFNEKHPMATKHLLPYRNKRCWSFHIILLIIAFLQTFPCSGKRHHTSYLPFLIPFIWCSIIFVDKSINDWTLDFVCQVDTRNLCVPLFPCGRNWQPCLLFDLYNIYVDVERLMIW
jgi:hypothetical protein